MFLMIVKMSGVTLLYILLVAVTWFWLRDKKLTKSKKVLIGLIFGMSSVLSTHFGVDYEHMVINVRDMGPLCAGLFFSPVSGIIAGLIGGIERYIVGTYFGIGSYTRIACSISTCLAGFVAMGMNVKVFKGKKPSPFYAFFMGAVMEVFHMYVVFVTHRNDMRMAFKVVSTCSKPMIIFTGIGMAVSSIMLQIFMKEWRNPFVRGEEEKVSVSQRFQRWLFVITSIVVIGNFLVAYFLQTQSADQDSKEILKENAESILRYYHRGYDKIDADSNVSWQILSEDGVVIKGENQGQKMLEEEFEKIRKQDGKIFKGTVWGKASVIYVCLDEGHERLVISMDNSEVYWYRNAEAYELALGDILLFTVIYVLIALLVNQIVVNNIRLINNSLGKITNGDLNEVVTVRSSSEFASLSDDINQTVVALKGYIDAAEKRIEQELMFAKSIQEAALPKCFSFPDRDEFELFASMNPAKEVGGDFYDFFFVDRKRIALVIADVSGKGIPAALFMMRSKTTIRNLAEAGGTPAEILVKANGVLCEGNDAEMFVTVWIGIVDLTTGLMRCANAGHEYPVIRHQKGDYEYLKDKHSLALAAMPATKAKEYEIQLMPGDKLFVYTDGIPEAINEKVEQYGPDRLLETLNRIKDGSIADTLPYVSESLEEFKGTADQFDDITMLGFEFKKVTGIS